MHRVGIGVEHGQIRHPQWNSARRKRDGLFKGGYCDVASCESWWLGKRQNFMLELAAGPVKSRHEADPFARLKIRYDLNRMTLAAPTIQPPGQVSDYILGAAGGIDI
jgi:hypothetical protein